MSTSNDDAVIQRLARLGERYPQIRAMILTSSRANPNAHCDVLSDYDVIVYSEDTTPFTDDETWFRELGQVLVTICPGFEEAGRQVPTRLVLYEDGTKADFTIRSVADLRALSDAGAPPDDHGYIVVLDKDALATSLASPTHREHVPQVPTELEYASLVNDFWWDSTYVSRYLWREDLMAVKLMLDHHLKQDYLRPMLEWLVECDRGWSWRPGAFGRGLAEALDPQTSRQLADTYAAAGTEELWEALLRTAALFRAVAVRVAERLGYAYLYDLDRRVMVYHRALKALPRHTACEDDLPRLLAAGYLGSDTSTA